MKGGGHSMSRRRKRSYEGCWISPDKGLLRLRYRIRSPDGRRKCAAFGTGLNDSPENRERLEPLRRAAGALVDAGKDPRPYLEESFTRPGESSDVLVATGET